MKRTAEVIKMKTITAEVSDDRGFVSGTLVIEVPDNASSFDIQCAFNQEFIDTILPDISYNIIENDEEEEE